MLLSEVRQGLARLSEFEKGERARMYIDGKFHLGRIRDIRFSGCSDSSSSSAIEESNSKAEDDDMKFQYECSTYRLWDYLNDPRTNDIYNVWKDEKIKQCSVETGLSTISLAWDSEHHPSDDGRIDEPLKKKRRRTLSISSSSSSSSTVEEQVVMITVNSPFSE